jgi:hypothetical protein
MLRTMLVMATLTVTSAAWAADAPPLPSTAKKLNGQEIEQLYHDAHATGTNFQRKSILKYTVTMNSKKKSIVGKWEFDGKTGKVDLIYDIQDDKWCNKPPKGGEEKCMSIYTDGGDVYSVDDKGAVAAKIVVTH